MENSDPNTKLFIGFPKSNEDHRLQLVAINDSIFAILHSPLESLGPIRLYCEEWSLVLLSPIKSNSNVLISGINVICLSEIISNENNINIHASNRLVKFTGLLKPSEKISEIGEKGFFQSNDDPGSFIYFYRLFKDLVANAQSKNPKLLSQAQQQFTTALCTLADKIKTDKKDLNFLEVLEFWNIPLLKTPPQTK